MTNSQVNGKFTESFDDQFSHDSYNSLSREFMENNPGTFEDLQNKTKVPQPVDGVKVQAHLPFTDSSACALTWAYGSEGNNRFNPSINFTTSMLSRKSDRNLMGMVEYDGTKNFGISLYHFISPNFRLKGQFQGNLSKTENAELVAQYFGKSYSLVFTLVDPNFRKCSGLLVGQYLKRVTSSIDAGMELVTDLNLKGPKMMLPSIVFRFRHGIHVDENKSSLPIGGIPSLESKTTFLSTFNPRAVHLSFSRHISSGLQLYSTYDYTQMSQFPHVTSIGYVYSIPKNELTVKSSYDTTQTIQTVIEKTFTSGNFCWSFGVSLAHNFTANKTITGVEFSLGK